MRTSLRLTILAVLLACTTGLQAASTIQFTATAYTVHEEAGAVTLTVQRLDDTNTVVSVDYATTNLTATAGLKYTTVSGTLTFAAGETNRVIAVPILNEGFVEGNQTFQVILSNSTGGAVLGGRTTATVRIYDNDAGIQFEFASYSVAEDAGSVLIGLVRGNDVDLPPFTVDYATANVTATSGVDYKGVTNTLTFAAGETVKLFTVPILNDSFKEPNKNFRLTLSNPTGGGVLGGLKTATVTIVDNDPGVQFEFNQYWFQENEGTLTVKVLRGSDVDLPSFTVDFATSNLTATAGEDYTEIKGTLEFAAGDTVKTLTIPITYDETAEPDEKLKLTLSNPSGGILLGPNKTASITILDTTGMLAHRFDRIASLPDQSIQLTLAGGVHKRFKPYFDLYPIEVSTNLVDWTPLVTLQRTNSSTNILTYTDLAAAKSDRRFYRTVTNHLITPLSQPTGPFPVGLISRLVTDPTRRNRYFLSTNGSFMGSIWYPAVAEAGMLPGPLEDERLAKDLNWLMAYLGDTSLVDRLPYVVSYALPGARCAPNEAPYPILIYSPGGWGERTEVAERGPDLASHGYVVVAADPADATGTVFPDATYLQGDSNLCLSDPGFQDRVQDLRFVLDELDRWNRADPVFAGRLDVTNVATMGWSWGGGVAGEVARIDDRCKAAIVLEGYFQNASDLVRFGLTKPSLSIYASHGGGEPLWLFDKATHDATWFQIAATTHGDFGDYPGNWRFGREPTRTMNAYILWFLNKYLKGLDEPMPALKDYPRVINFKQK